MKIIESENVERMSSQEMNSVCGGMISPLGKLIKIGTKLLTGVGAYEAAKDIVDGYQACSS